MSIDEPKNHYEASTVKEMMLELKHIENDIGEINSRQKRLEGEIFGNGKEGLRIQVAKIKQILFFATSVATIILTLMVTDLFGRLTGVRPGEVQDEVRKAVIELKKNQHDIEESLRKILNQKS